MSLAHIEPHPLLDLRAFEIAPPAAQGTLPDATALRALLSLDAPAPVERSDEVKAAVRNLLRQGGFAPNGRNKPSSEYLVKAVEQGRMGPDDGLLPLVDLCNAVSLHSGLPISVIDLDRREGDLAVRIAGDTGYVFNPSGQELGVKGLLCIHDEHGPCGAPVKDSLRTRTTEDTTHSLFVIWGSHEIPEQTEKAAAWLQELAEQQGWTVGPVPL